MNIYFTRHARQRLKLYKIERKDIETLLTEHAADQEPLNEHKEFVSDAFVLTYGFPLKVVFVHEAARIVVITVYRLDRETQYEDIIR